MTQIQVNSLNPESDLTKLDVLTQNKICGGYIAANSTTNYGDSTSSFNITKFEAGDTGFVVNQVNVGDGDIYLPYQNGNKVSHYINQTGNGTVTIEGY